MPFTLRICRPCAVAALLALAAWARCPARASAAADASLRSFPPGATAAPTSSEARLVQLANAAGATDVEITRALARYRLLAQELRVSSLPVDRSAQAAESLHAFLHRRVLHGAYQAQASDLAAALTGGPYNCTSATALLIALAQELQLPAVAVAGSGHVWCRLVVGGRPFDIETTQPHWTKGQLPQETRMRAGRPLDHAGLLALVHYNRGVRLHRQGRFAEAIDANRLALQLDPLCVPARGNLLAAVRNWSLMLSASGQAAQALPALAEGLAVAADDWPLRVEVERWVRQALVPANFLPH
jgi:tetratricopeptide (TPR) repeat protein